MLKSKLFLTIVTLLTVNLFAHDIIIYPPIAPPHPPMPPGRIAPQPTQPVSLKQQTISVNINNNIATTIVEQTFYNPNHRRIEGTYIFPFPAESTIKHFSMDIDGKMTNAELLSADKARKIYTDIVRQMKDPALLEYVGYQTLRLSIFPIEARSSRKIKIIYTELLKQDNNAIKYSYLLKTPGNNRFPIKKLKVNVNIKTSYSLKNIYLPGFDAKIKQLTGKTASISYNGSNVMPDKNFKVIFSQNKQPVGISLISYKEPGQDGYFMLMASPGKITSKADIQPKNICFVIDTSGSMQGDKIIQAKNALSSFVDKLTDKDTFEIVSFSSESTQHFNKLLPATSVNRKSAHKFIDSIYAKGGTAIHDTLLESLQTANSHQSDYPTMIIFITDGIPTVGETNDEKITESIKHACRNTRIFTFGIGTNVNTHLIDNIAENSRGSSTYILPDEDIEEKLSNVYNKISKPVMTDIKLSFSVSGIQNLHPNKLNDMFDGEVVTIFGRYRNPGNCEVSLTGNMKGKEQTIKATVNLTGNDTKNDFIPKIWATRRVGWLLDEIRLNGESKELKDEITFLAKKYGIITPYTAYLIIEDEKTRPAQTRIMDNFEGNTEAVAEVKKQYESMAKEKSSSRFRSGDMAVNSAMSIQQLKSGSAAPAPSYFQDSAKQAHSNIRKQQQKTRYIAGKTFYLTNNSWIDSEFQTGKPVKTLKIKFNSSEYFALLSEENFAQWLSIGQNVHIVSKGILYIIEK